MPDFGDVFLESYRFGKQQTQQDAQHAEAVAMEEKKLAATTAMEGLKMDALNRQIDITKQEELNRAKYQYDSLHDRRLETLGQQYISVKGDPAFKRAPKISGGQLMKQFDVAGIDPNDERVPVQYFQLVKLVEMERNKEERMNAPITLANDLNSELDKFALPQDRQINIPKEPTFYDRLDASLRADLTAEHGASFYGDKNWNELPSSNKDPIQKLVGTATRNISRAWNFPPTQYETRNESNPEAIKQYLEQSAPTIRKMLSRGKEDIGKYHSDAITGYADYAQNFLIQDASGNIDLKIPNASPVTERTAKQALVLVHTARFNYEMSEARAKMQSVIAGKDKDAIAEAEKEYQSAILETMKKYPLRGQDIGQHVGQRYVK